MLPLSKRHLLVQMAQRTSLEIQAWGPCFTLLRWKVLFNKGHILRTHYARQQDFGQDYGYCFCSFQIPIWRLLFQVHQTCASVASALSSAYTEGRHLGIGIVLNSYRDMAHFYALMRSTSKKFQVKLMSTMCMQGKEGWNLWTVRGTEIEWQIVHIIGIFSFF